MRRFASHLAKTHGVSGCVEAARERVLGDRLAMSPRPAHAAVARLRVLPTWSRRGGLAHPHQPASRCPCRSACV